MRLIAVYFLMSLFCCPVFGQRTLSGVLTEVQTQKAISDVSIYFPELFRGTTTDMDGHFRIPGIPQGRVLVQFSHVGYETSFLHVSLKADTTLAIAITPSRIEMPEVVITGTQSQSPYETTYNIAQLTYPQLFASGALTITDGIAKLPGISQLTTGAGISKPVIRGLYGNRIQVNVNGIRFDNQQWQDEHGLGLSDMGIDRIEVIRGPASVLYGSDAMGGVLNIIDEKPAPENSKIQDLGVRLYANTYGLSANAGFRKSVKNRWRNFRIGLDNHADYSDGHGSRILNSRFATYNLKASWGVHKANSDHVLHLNASHSLFGFVFDSLFRKQEDARLSRSFDGPHHAVSFIQANTENTYFKQGKKIKFNVGLISNLRLEDEGGGGVSLAMLLNTINTLGQITQQVGKSGTWTYGTSALFQTNTNFGGRIIVPDAINGEFSLYSLYQHRLVRWLLEGGVRYDLKFVETYATNTLNIIGNDSPSQDILPFASVYHAGNFHLGVMYDLAPAITFKVNASTGYRPGNLAELSSNGLHEGTLRWEIGLPSARIEQNFNMEGTLSYQGKFLRAAISAYQNRFTNYFYLNGTGNEYYGFSIYRYEQSDARFRGGEATLDWNPLGSRLEFNASYSFIEAQKSNGDNLPFIPANKVTSEVRFHAGPFGEVNHPMLRIGGTYYADQHRPAEFETPTAGYLLLNAGISGAWRNVRIALACNNLWNKYYYDHLSRFKYYGIANMGRNIVLSMNFTI